MQALRNARWITRFVLVWFAFFLSAAVASPLVKPVGTEMVCTAMGGMKLVNLDTDQDTPTIASNGMECPLCTPSTCPAPTAMTIPHPGGLSYALGPLESARLISLIGLPWQARGPPSLPI